MGGVLLAVSRAIGETMIVVMAAGLTANLTANPLEAVTTVTVQIVTLLVGDQEFDSPKTLGGLRPGPGCCSSSRSSSTSLPCASSRNIESNMSDVPDDCIGDQAPGPQRQAHPWPLCRRTPLPPLWPAGRGSCHRHAGGAAGLGLQQGLQRVLPHRSGARHRARSGRHHAGRQERCRHAGQRPTIRAWSRKR